DPELLHGILLPALRVPRTGLAGPEGAGPVGARPAEAPRTPVPRLRGAAPAALHTADVPRAGAGRPSAVLALLPHRVGHRPRLVPRAAPGLLARLRADPAPPPEADRHPRSPRDIAAVGADPRLRGRARRRLLPV